MSTKTQQPILVTGASGHLGRSVLKHLLETEKFPPGKITATTRNVSALADFAARGITIRQADFEDAASLAAAFAGSKRLLLISTDTLDRPGHRLQQHRNAIAAAVKAGVEHIVYTSMPNPENSPLLIAPDHAETEHALAASPLTSIILRNNWYFENLFLGLPQYLASGLWYSASGDGRIAHIARDDLGRAAAAALASADTGNRIYNLTGRKAYSTEEIARLVSATAGKPIQVVPVPVEALIQGMIQAGMPEGLATIFASFDTNTAAGRVADITDDFLKLTGVHPQDYQDWLAANRANIAG
ncbi:MAG: NAD(P)-dependent oxidoreductase [Betaproteobacteria bacterium HGW-Betaproteobacteria-1]|jgi:NAD(P)H dehydrogenase (quinone)|nr:MAG: NAD(P)-dependent oxidoreductase [Betaproteobacteria bacterium HGW-Betaproteobacteria-1]